MWRRLLCLIGVHDYRILRHIHGYITTLTFWERGDMGTVHHVVTAETCSRCGKRRLQTSGEGHKDHAGLKKLRLRWVWEGKL